MDSYDRQVGSYPALACEGSKELRSEMNKIVAGRQWPTAEEALLLVEFLQ